MGNDTVTAQIAAIWYTTSIQAPTTAFIGFSIDGPLPTDGIREWMDCTGMDPISRFFAGIPMCRRDTTVGASRDVGRGNGAWGCDRFSYNFDAVRQRAD